MAEKLVVMLSGAYLHRMVQRQLPTSCQERHCNQTFCLCQFLELFIDDMFRSLAGENNIKEFKGVLLNDLNFFISSENLKVFMARLILHDEFSFVSI